MIVNLSCRAVVKPTGLSQPEVLVTVPVLEKNKHRGWMTEPLSLALVLHLARPPCPDLAPGGKVNSLGFLVLGAAM